MNEATPTNGVNVTLATPDCRSTVRTDDNISIEDLLSQQNVNYSAASVMIDGTPLPANQLKKTLKELDAGSNCTISVCVKLQNA